MSDPWRALDPVEGAVLRAAQARAFLPGPALEALVAEVAQARAEGRAFDVLTELSRRVPREHLTALSEALREARSRAGAASGRAPAAATSLVGGVLEGRYRVERELARGGMGVVYLAHDQRLDRPVALKQMLVGQATAADVERFQREARAVARLQHPGIVRVYDVFAAGGSWFMTMDFIEGESLQDRLARAGRLPPREAAGLVRQVAGAMAYAHEQGVLHRDLKPHNVLVDRRGTPLVTDFGLAKLDQTPDLPAAPRAPQAERAAASLTQTGQLMGTPAFMPPEQADGDKARVDARADVYSLGATLYALLCGRPPFEGDSLVSLLTKLFSEPPRPPRALNPAVDPALEALCLRCLEKEPADRFPSCAELEAALAAWEAAAAAPDAGSSTAGAPPPAGASPPAPTRPAPSRAQPAPRPQAPPARRAASQRRRAAPEEESHERPAPTLIVGASLAVVLLLVLGFLALRPRRAGETAEGSPATETTPGPDAPEANTSPEANPSPEASPSPEARPSPGASRSPEARPSPEARSSPEASTSPAATASAKASTSPEASPSPAATASPEADPPPAATASSTPTTAASAGPEATPTGEPSPRPDERAQALLQRGAALLEQGDLPGARVALREATALGEPRAGLLLAQLELKAQDPAAARAVCDLLLARYPEQVEARLLRAAISQAQGDDAAALVDLNALLERAPRHAPALKSRATLLARAGQLAPAQRDVEALLADQPRDLDALRLAARVALPQGPEPLRAALQRGLSSYPGDPVLGLIEALAAVGTAQPKLAARELQRAVARVGQPREPLTQDLRQEAWRALIRLALEHGAGSGLGEARQLVAERPRDPAARLLLARCLERGHCGPEAKTAYEEVLALEPGDAEAKEALVRLAQPPLLGEAQELVELELHGGNQVVGKLVARVHRPGKDWRFVDLGAKGAGSSKQDRAWAERFPAEPTDHWLGCDFDGIQGGRPRYVRDLGSKVRGVRRYAGLLWHPEDDARIWLRTMCLELTPCDGTRAAQMLKAGIEQEPDLRASGVRPCSTGGGPGHSLEVRRADATDLVVWIGRVVPSGRKLNDFAVLSVTLECPEPKTRTKRLKDLKRLLATLRL
ncbi:MAG: protein kinase [Planctomycetota bacterium]